MNDRTPNYCARCGDPNGTPCDSCGYRNPGWTPFVAREYTYPTESDADFARRMRDLEDDSREREERRERYA